MSEVITDGTGQHVLTIEPLPVELPTYTAEVRFWSKDDASRPVLSATATGTAKVVARMVETAADTFLEDSER